MILNNKIYSLIYTHFLLIIINNRYFTIGTSIYKHKNKLYNSKFQIV